MKEFFLNFQPSKLVQKDENIFQFSSIFSIKRENGDAFNHSIYPIIQKKQKKKKKCSPMKPFFASSRVNLRVMRSSSFSLYSFGFILTPALAPPKGTSTQAHLNVISADKALTSSLETSSEKRIPEKTISI